MQPSIWRRGLVRLLGQRFGHSQAAPARHVNRAKLGVELLENRLAPATLNWIGGGGNANWSTAANWTGGAAGEVPGAGDILSFDTTAAGFTNAFTSSNDLTGLALGGLVINDTSAAGDFSISGEAVSLTGNLTHKVTAGVGSSLALDGLTLSGNLGLTNNNGTFTIGSNVNMGAFVLTALAPLGTVVPQVTINGNLTGTGTLNVDRGALRVNGDLEVNNLRVGFRDVNGVTVSASAVANLTVGDGSVVTIGAGTANSLTIGQRIGGATVVPLSPVTGTLDLSRAASVDINVGNLRMGDVPSSNNAAPVVADVVGHLFLSQSGANEVSASNIVMGDSPNPANFNIPSTMTLGGALNTFRVNNFTIGARKGAATVSIVAGGTLDLANLAGTGGANLNLGDNVTANTGTLGSGVLNLAGGTFNANIDTLVLGRFLSAGGTASGTLIMDAGSVTATTILIAQAGSSTNTTTDNVGILTLNGGAINAGTISLGQGRGKATINLAGGDLNVGTLSFAPGTGGAANVNLNSGTLAAQTITRTGTAGTVAFNWNGGTLRNRAGGDLSIANVPISVLGAGSHTFVVDAGQTATVQSSSALTDLGALTKDGSGTLVLAGTNSLTGAVAVNAGTLLVNGTLATSANAVTISGTLGGTGTINRAISVASGGILAPGTTGAGILTANSVDFASGAIFRADVLGATAGSQYDRFVAGSVNLGNATLELVGGFAPPASFNLLLIDAATLTGGFNGVSEGGVVHVGDFYAALSYLGNDVRLSYVNVAPVIGDAAFTIAENSANGTVVGTVVASDPNLGQTLTYTITAGNPNGIFAINASTGVITVANGALLNFDLIPVHGLTVRVTDSDTPSLSSTATITINLTETNDPPVIGDQIFTLDENSADATIVGTVLASESNLGQSLSYAIIAGNTGNAFAIDAATGKITVLNGAALNYETNPVFTLTVQVTDNGVPAQSSTATITINLTNVNEAPVAGDLEFTIGDNSLSGATVGAVTGSDPDASQSLTYAITAGNSAGVFAINASTGMIIVVNSALLNAHVTPLYTLTVQAADSGTPGLFTTATITINIIEINELPVIGDQSFTLDENRVDGTIVGTVAASDPNESQSLTYVITAGNTGNAFAIDAATGRITVLTSVAVDFEANPVFTLTVQVTDSGDPALASSATITINLINRNDPPLASEVSLTTSLLVPIIIDLRSLVRDVETSLDQLTFMVGNPVNGTVILLDSHTAQFSPSAVGAGSFTYTVTDTAGAGDSAWTTGPTTVHVTIEEPQPLPPEGSDNVYASDEDTAITGNVLTDDSGAGVDSDINGDSLTVSAVNGDSTAVGAVVTLASGARVTVNGDGSFSYDPTSSVLFNQLAVGQTAVDSFTYTVSDGQGGFDTAVVTINLEGVNDVPTTGPLAWTMTGRSNLSTKITLAKQLTGFHDAEGEPLQVQLVKLPAKGRLIQDKSGNLIYKPPQNFKGNVTFTYQVVDSHNATSELVTVTLRIVRQGRQGSR